MTSFGPSSTARSSRLMTWGRAYEPDFPFRRAIHLVLPAFGPDRQLVYRAGTEEAPTALGAGTLVPLRGAPLFAIVGVRARSGRRCRSEDCDGRDRLWRPDVGGSLAARGALSALQGVRGHCDCVGSQR